MTQHVPHLTSSKDQEKLLNVLHRCLEDAGEKLVKVL